MANDVVVTAIEGTEDACEKRGMISSGYHAVSEWVSNNPGTTLLIAGGLGLATYGYGKHRAKKHLAELAYARAEELGI